MDDWPDQVPSPRLVAAWWVLGTVPAERIPLWAAHWLVVGYDGEALVELAGLSGRDPGPVHELLGVALGDCGLDGSDLDTTERGRKRAAAMTAMTAFTAIAELHAQGRATEQWVLDKIYEMVENDRMVGPDPGQSVTSLPLGRLYLLADERESPRLPADDHMRAIVQQACREQLAAAFDHPAPARADRPAGTEAVPRS
ncbi:hypothetical protein [Pseudofrankia asymbiotica]|uniref:Uncharacterized protein n=1 Tax=Pseudofrankia asymbiotica TaxID=1834516 RepID=A0A1V2HZC3_9ACTN|nr:hypothetical protein [Pseudofrankia asymbiotica]ONH22044.1 hypothetical protein BL253_36865 [Pseudofrankia asymbiotica]